MRDVAIVKIDLVRCINCSLCRRACPTECIHFYSTGKRTHVVDPEWCIGCDICVQVCPVDCIDDVPEFAINPAQLERAKDKARAHAKTQHSIKLMRRTRAMAAAEAVAPR